MKRFDLVTKKAFRGGANEEFIIPVPGLADDAAQGVRRGKLKMSGTDIKKILDPVVDEVVALVRGQIAAANKKVKAVLIVGGFGQNAYLREMVRASLTADLSCIPVGELTQKMGKDGLMYYVIYYEIEMTYYSAEMKYALVCKSVKYASVTAEYV